MGARGLALLCVGQTHMKFQRLFLDLKDVCDVSLSQNRSIDSCMHTYMIREVYEYACRLHLRISLRSERRSYEECD